MDDVLRCPVRFSRGSWAVLWATEQPDVELHPALAVSLPHELGGESLPAAVGHTAGELSRLGLYHPARGVHPDLLGTLPLLARPAVEVYGWLGRHDQATPVSALAAVDGRRGVLAVLDHTGIRLTPIPPDDPARALVGILAPVPAATGQPITVAAADLAPPAPDPDAPMFTGLTRPPPDPALGRLRTLLRQPRTAVAQLHAAQRLDGGPRRRAPSPLTVIDTAAGRWSIRRSPSAAGDMRITAAPTTAAALAAQLSDLLPR